MNHHIRHLHKHPVHHVYAWVMLGFVIGMVSTTMYLSGKSVSLLTAEAAGVKNITISGAVEPDSQLFSVAIFGQNKWIANQISRTINAPGSYSVPEPTTVHNGMPIVAALGGTFTHQAVLYNQNSGNIYLSTSGVISTAQPTTNVRTKVYEHKFSAYYLRKNGQKVPVEVEGGFLPALDVPGWNAYNRVQTLSAQDTITVPGGIPYFTTTYQRRPELGLRFKNVPESGDQEANRNYTIDFVAPPTPRSGTWEFIIKQKVYGQPESGYSLVSTTFVPAPNHAPKVGVHATESVTVGQRLSFRANAVDEDGDTIVFMATGLPAGATLSGTTGEFNWTPPVSAAGKTYNVTIRAFDGRGGITEAPVKIIVEDISTQPETNTDSE